MIFIKYFTAYVRIIRTGKSSTVLNTCLALGYLRPPIFIRFVDIWLRKSACIMYFFWDMVFHYWELAA
jgi:hypothetical protein